jgi:hypothetical protein
MIPINDAATDVAHYALTADQSAQLDRDVSEMRSKAEEISILVSASFGGSTEIAFRAGEADAALQRLQWAWERQRADQTTDTAPGVSEYLATHPHTSKAASASAR